MPLSIERCYHQALIHPRLAPKIVNLKNFPRPRLRLPPALEEGEGWCGGSETGGGGGSSFHFLLF